LIGSLVFALWCIGNKESGTSSFDKWNVWVHSSRQPVWTLKVE
jgi:hypothetical protein